MKVESPSVIDDVVGRLVIAPTSNTHLEESTKVAERVFGVRGLNLTDYFIPRTFSVGEFCPKFLLNGKSHSLHDKTVYVTMTPGPYKSSDELWERVCKVSVAAKDNGARKVCLLATDFPDGRQDRGPSEDVKAEGEPNSVRWHARQLEAAGVDQVITTHEHSPRIAAFFAIEYGLIPKEMLPVEARGFRPRDIKVPRHIDPNNSEVQALGRKVFKSISPHALLADYILHRSSLVGTPYLKNEGALLALKAVDGGNRRFIDELYQALFLPDAVRLYCDKLRKEKNDPNAVKVEVAEVSDNFVTLDGLLEIFADDGLDTGGTMSDAVRWSDKGNICSKTGREYGRPKDRLVYFTHAWLGGESHLDVQERLIKQIPTQEFVMTNTRPYISDSQYYRFKEVSTILRFAGLWADAIIANELGHDIMKRYTGFETEEQQHEFLDPLYALKRHTRHFMIEGDRTEKRKIHFTLRD